MALVGELLNNYVHFITKQMQEIADALWGAENDNSEKLINLPHSISAQTYYKVKGTVASDYTDIPGYYDWQFNFGNFYFLCTSSFTYYNGNISVGPVTKMGRLNVNEWNLINSDVKDLADDILTDYIDSHNTIDIIKTSANGIIYSESFDSSMDNYTFTLDGLYTNVKAKYPAYNGDLIQSGIQLRLVFYDIYEYDGGYYNDWSTVGICPPEIFYAQSKGATMITRTNNQDVINNIINNSGSTHNYTNTYVSENGDTITTYYGDNYIITKANNDAETTYKEYYDALVDIVNQINTDTGDDITVPTYNENKYGPEPPPPPPPTDDDDIDDQTIGAGANLASIARLWLLTRQQLIDLHAAFTSAPANYDPLSSFIGVLGFGVQPIKVVGDSLPWTLNPINIRMSNGETWRTGVEAHIVDSQVSAFSFPNIQIKKRYNNFLDYSPYATHEIFIPMCGWLTLPDIAVDRTISVTYLPDLESMRCRAVVSVVDEDGDKCVIGVKDGIMGAEVPFSNLNHSVWLANLITNAADVTGEIVTGAIGAGFTKTNAKGGTYRPYEGFTIGMAGTLPGAVGNALLSGNVNRTHVVGSNGNRTGFSDGDCIMIKSTYHKIDKPDNYDHTIGKVCNKTGQLSEFHGFTVCDNPHIHISALDEEKEEIKRLLEEGVILPDGE